MFYGLSHLESEFYAHNLHKVVALAPCFIANVEIYHIPQSLDPTEYQDYGIYAFNGPNWDRDLQTICDNFPEEYCEEW